MRREVKKVLLVAATSFIFVSSPSSIRAQVAPLLTTIGMCNIGSVASATKITTSNCVFASFTGAVSGNVLTASSVTGSILQGQAVIGTGVPTGTYVTGSGTGTGGAGTYNLSTSSVVSSESMTTSGVPPFARYLVICVSTQAVNYRGDKTAPTAAVGGGQPITAGQCVNYPSTSVKMTDLQFVQQAGGAVVTMEFFQ